MLYPPPVKELKKGQHAQGTIAKAKAKTKQNKKRGNKMGEMLATRVVVRVEEDVQGKVLVERVPACSLR